VAAWFQSTGTGSLRISPATGTFHEFTGTIRNGDGGRVLSVTKSGEGQQTFSGTGQYTGTTLVENGTLLVNGDFSAATGLVTLNSGATLGGEGSVGGELSASGSISPGIGAGTLSVLNHVTWNGSSSNPWVWQIAVEGESDLLYISGNFVKGSGSVYLFDFAGTGAPGTYKLVEWGGSNTFAASQFGAQNLAAGLEGVFEISGKQLNLIVTATTPTGGYEAWSDTAFPAGTSVAQREPAADFDLDGVVNLLEYALGTSPSAPSVVPAASVLENAGSRFLQLVWTRPIGRGDAVVTGETSADLTSGSWSSSAVLVSTTITPAGPGMETVTVRLVDPIGAAGMRFLRARVTLP
jgi:autotransporter-associated beta strand protein